MTVEAIRALNEDGLRAFQAFIEATRAAEKRGDPRQSPPKYLLTDEAMTQNIGVVVSVDDSKVFTNRFDMAVYLNGLFDPVFDERFYTNVGLWAWLSLFNFDQLRAVKIVTQRSEHFIPDEWAKQTPGQDLGYRHSVRTPVQILRNYGEDFAKFLLTGRPTSQMGDIIEQFISRPKVFGSERVRATMLSLYQAKGGGFKRGAANVPAKTRKSDSGRGGIRRFAKVYVPRVKLGYDINEMETPDIVTACGPEISDSKFAKA